MLFPTLADDQLPHHVPPAVRCAACGTLTRDPRRVLVPGSPCSDDSMPDVCSDSQEEPACSTACQSALEATEYRCDHPARPVPADSPTIVAVYAVGPTPISAPLQISTPPRSQVV